MAQLTKSLKLYRKAEAALIAAIEIYNKPDFKYREETFSILTLNSWELLLKAKLLHEKSNNTRSLSVYENRQTQSGKTSKKRYLKRNRSGNCQTLSLGQTIVTLENETPTKIPTEIKKNLDALIEIRDNAIHYINPSSILSKQILEIGTASLRNFVELSKRWFHEDLSRYNLFLMPIGFLISPAATSIVGLPDEEANLMKYLAALVKEDDGENPSDFHVSLEINLSFKRTSTDSAIAVALTKDPDALKVTVTEEDIRKTYKWDFAEMTERCRERYIDFKADKKYHEARKVLKTDARFIRSRYLDPGNPKSPKKDFYNPNILSEFDKYYTLRSS